MKTFFKIILISLLLITLVSVQICLLKYEHTTNFNILLIFYNYILFNHISTLIAAILLIMMDGISFFMTGYFGFITIFMAIFSMLALRYDNHFYNKLVMPIISTALCIITQNILFYKILHYTSYISDSLIAILINSCVLIIFWLITKQPIHK